MDKRTTPKNKSDLGCFSRIKSGNKRSTPTSSTLNSTFASSSSRSVHHNFSRRQNLDATLLNTQPKFKQALSTLPSDNLEYDLEAKLTYNEYLQALFQEEIVEESVEAQKELLNEQILTQNENLNRAYIMRSQIVYETHELKNQTDTIEVLYFLDKYINDFVTACSLYDISKEITVLRNILRNECGNVHLKNVKLIKTQGEYNNLFIELEACAKAMERIKSGIYFDSINELAKNITNLDKIRFSIENNYKDVIQMQKHFFYNFLNGASDMFAKQGGYM